MCIRDRTRSWGGNNPGTQTEDTGILYNCSTTLSAYIDENNVTQPARTTSPLGIGASVDVYFEGGDVKAIRCKNPYNGSVSANGYKIGDVLTINGTGASSGIANWSGSAPSGATISGAGTGATFMINRYEGVGVGAKINGVKGRLRGPIDDRGIKIANGGENYQVGQLVNVAQLGNPLPLDKNPANNIGAPQGGSPGGSGGVDASFTVVGVFDKGDVTIGKDEGAEDDREDNGGGGFANMLSSLSGVLGNLTSALDFDNMPTNIFPFELPPNKALADFYTLGDAGQSAPDTEIPMMGQITKMASKPPYVPVNNLEDLPFALPVNPQNLNLKIRATAKDAQVALDNTVAGWRNASSRLMDT